MVGMRHWPSCALLTTGLLACGSGSKGTEGAGAPDGGPMSTTVPEDGGSLPEAGSALDGGSAQNADASTSGVPSEGGPDSGTSGVWRPFDDASPWNTVIRSGAAIDPASSTMISDLTSISG